METGKTVTKVSNFAGDSLPVGMYSKASPSTLLKRIMAAEQMNGSLDFSAEETERIMQGMPEVMVGMKADSKGRMEFSALKRADFLNPQNPQGSTVKGSGLISILTADVVAEGAMPYTAARNVLSTVRMTGGAEQIPFFTARPKADEVSPGADAYDLAQGLGKALAIPKQYRLMASLDKGLLADSSLDVKVNVLREMGACTEIAIEEEAVSVCKANAYSTATTCSATDALKGLNLARGQVGVNKYRASGAIISPMFEAQALNSMAVPAYNETAQGIGTNANLLRFAGLDLGVSGASGLAWASSSDVGALVVDKSRAPVIAIREDLSADEFDNVTKNLLQPCVTTRFCVVPLVEGKKTDNKGAVVEVAVS